MNVFLCCLQSRVHTGASVGSFWRANFKTALERLGHRVVEPEGVDLVEPLLRRGDRGAASRLRADNSAALVAEVRSAHERIGIDLFFSYFWAVHIEPGALKQIQRLGMPTVNFFCDNLREFHEVAALVDSVTLNWVPEVAAIPLYERRAVPFIHLPMAADPEFYRPVAGDERDVVAFVGSPDYLRAELLESVLAAGVPLEVYGDAWRPHAPTAAHRSGGRPRIRASVRQHLDRLQWYGWRGELRHFATRSRGRRERAAVGRVAQPSLGHEAMLRVTACSAVVLGINRCPSAGYPVDRPLVYSRLRDFEAPMSGACYLTETSPDLAHLYELGTEVAVYENEAELLEQIDRLRRDAGWRARLRAGGRRAALTRHRWEHRFEKLFAALGIGGGRR